MRSRQTRGAVHWNDDDARDRRRDTGCGGGSRRGVRMFWVLVALHGLEVLCGSASETHAAHRRRGQGAANTPGRRRRRRRRTAPRIEAELPLWGLRRIQQGRPLRLAAAGLSRSGSTWQFNALRIILQHALEAHAPKNEPTPQMHSQHGHTMDEIQGCLNRDYCVVKVRGARRAAGAIRRAIL